MKIDATEIERQATRVDEEINIFYNSCNSVIKRLDEMQSIVESNDSYLSRKIGEYMQSYITLQSVIKNEFSNLAKTMHSYASNTLKNELSMQDEVQKITNAAESNTEFIKNVNDEVPQFYVDWN